MSDRSRGFSLLELLIAMSLFLVLGAALVALTTRALDFLDTGSKGTEVLDKGTDFFRPFASDLENVLVERSVEAGVPEIRMLSDYVPIDSDLDGTVDYLAQRFAFVRSTNIELSDSVARLGGSNPAADAYLDGKMDAEQAEAGKLRPLGGQMAVLYMAVPDDPPQADTAREPDGPGVVPDKPKPTAEPGLLRLYRATQSPLGAPKSLLERDTVKTAADMRKVGQTLLADVLYFGVRFWTPRTKTWDSVHGRPTSDGPSYSWDSTRGILPAGLRPNQFPFAMGEGSLADPGDDISPRSVRVTFVFARTGHDEDVGRLTEDIDDRAMSVKVDGTAFANTSNEQFIKVGTEWMAYASRSEDKFSIAARGVRGTVAVPHKKGEKVYAGYTAERTILIPSYREDWNLR